MPDMLGGWVGGAMGREWVESSGVMMQVYIVVNKGSEPELHSAHFYACGV